MQVRFFTPDFTRAEMQFSGMPHSPNPPRATVMPSFIPSIAAAAFLTTLFILIFFAFFFASLRRPPNPRRGLKSFLFCFAFSLRLCVFARGLLVLLRQ